MGRHTSIVDRIREHKTIIIQVAVVVAIAVVIAAIMIPQLAVSRGAYDALVTKYDGEFAKASASINKLGADLGDEIDDIETEIQGYNTTLDILGTKAAGNSHAIGTLQTWKDAAEIRIATVEALNSPPEGYLTGTMGNYTLHAKCSEAGNFTANVHLVYSPAIGVGNATTQDEALSAFYGSINWAASTVQDYVPTLTYNSTAWKVSQVWFNIGTFAMAANNVTSVDIIFSGLASAYNPDFAYVEVWPVLK